MRNIVLNRVYKPYVHSIKQVTPSALNPPLEILQKTYITPATKNSDDDRKPLLLTPYIAYSNLRSREIGTLEEIFV